MFGKKRGPVRTLMNEKIRERDHFLKNFPNYIVGYENIVLFQHIRPDGDCIGCVLGLKEILKEQFPDKKVYATGSNFGLFSNWLKMEFDELPENFDYSNSIAIVLDVGISQRIQKFDEYFKQTGKKWGAVLKIDHHESNTDFDVDLGWDDASYSSAACQLVQICDYFQWNMSPKAATYLYLGITTDSNSFFYASTLPRTLILGAKALRAGADRNLINENLSKLTFEKLKFRSYVIENCNKNSKNVLWFHVTNDLIKKFNVDIMDSSNVNIMANIEDNYLWMLLSDDVVSGKIVAELRSLDELDVKSLAEEFGGGGHKNAAGFTLTNVSQIPTVIKRIEEYVSEYIKKLEELRAAQKEEMKITEKELSPDQPLDEFVDISSDSQKEFEISKTAVQASEELLKETDGHTKNKKEELKNKEEEDKKNKEIEEENLKEEKSKKHKKDKKGDTDNKKE